MIRHHFVIAQMPYRYLSHPSIPLALRGPTLVDPQGVPRYWANVWSTMSLEHLADSTRASKLRHVEALYVHADQFLGQSALDHALARQDHEALASVLESWFISIRNRATNRRADELRWSAGLEFVRSISAWLAHSSGGHSRLPMSRVHRLGTLYSQLRIRKSYSSEGVRSLPSTTLQSLYELLDPEFPDNPFKHAETRWRVYVAFTLMLHQGLRRGELLILPVDCVKSGIDQRSQARRYWINVRQHEYEGEDELDPRYSRPSIKTASSIRQIPVSTKMARLIQTYAENYRGRPDHPYLINSSKDRPLATESLTKIFRIISSALPATATEELINRCNKTSVSPHDLRHTCAVVRLNQLLGAGDPMDEALQKMRTFFGWSRTSVMPSRYARAVFEDRLANVWNDSFDERIALIRAIPHQQ